MDLGLSIGEKPGVPSPIDQAARELLQQAIDAGYTDCDFGNMLELQAEASGMHLQSENTEVDDGLNLRSIHKGKLVMSLFGLAAGVLHL